MSNLPLNKNSFYNGVSQQNPELRLDNQSSDVINASLSVARGLEKRNGTELVYISDTETFSTNTTTHGFSGTDATDYILITNPPENDGDTATTLIVDTIGNSFKVLGDQSYLDCESPKDSLRFVTIGDTTLVVNTEVAPSLDPDSTFKGPLGPLQTTIFDSIDEIDWEPIPTYNGSTNLSLASSTDTYINFDLRRTSANTETPRIEMVGGIDLSGVNNQLELGNFSFQESTTDGNKFGTVDLWVDDVFHSTVYTFSKDNAGKKIDPIPLPTVSGSSKLSIVGDITDSNNVYRTKIRVRNTLRVTTESIVSDFNTTAYLWVKNGVQQVRRDADFWNTNTSSWLYAKATDNDSRKVIDDFVTHVNGEPGTSTAEDLSFAVARLSEPDAVGDETLLTATDSYSDTTMKVCHTKGSDFESLPPVARDSEVVKILSDDSTSSYYLQYSNVDSAWSECPGIGTRTDILNTTMPHQIILKVAEDDIPSEGIVKGETYFNIESIEWANRTVGDSEQSPDPSFIGNPIRDIFFYKNRLGFVTRESVVCSAIDDLFNFFPTTVKETLDDDPVDLTVSTNEAVFLNYASIFPDSMVISGDRIQYVLHSDSKPFTSENATLDIMSKYTTSPNVRPASTGTSLFLNLPLNEYTSFKEFIVATDTLLTEGSGISDHVSSYIPNSVKRVEVDSNLETLFVLTYDEPNTVFVYNWLDQGGSRVQSAWSKWTFEVDVIDIILFGANLYLITNDELRLEGGSTTETRDALYKINVEKSDPSSTAFKSYRPLVDKMSLINITDIYSESDRFGSPVRTVLKVTSDTYFGLIQEGNEISIIDRVTGIGYPITSFGDYSDLSYSDPGYYIWCDMPSITSNLLPSDIEKIDYSLQILDPGAMQDGTVDRLQILPKDPNNGISINDYNITITPTEGGRVFPKNSDGYVYYSRTGINYTEKLKIEYSLLGIKGTLDHEIPVVTTGFTPDDSNSNPSVYITSTNPAGLNPRFFLVGITNVDVSIPGEITFTTEDPELSYPLDTTMKIKFYNLLAGGDAVTGTGFSYYDITNIDETTDLKITVAMDENLGQYFGTNSYLYIQWLRDSGPLVDQLPGQKEELRAYYTYAETQNATTERYDFRFSETESGSDSLNWVQITNLFNNLVVPVDYDTYQTKYLIGYYSDSDSEDDEYYAFNDGESYSVQSDLDVIKANEALAVYIPYNGDLSIPDNRSFNVDAYLGDYSYLAGLYYDLNINVQKGRDWDLWT